MPQGSRIEFSPIVTISITHPLALYRTRQTTTWEAAVVAKSDPNKEHFLASKHENNYRKARPLQI